MKFLVVLSVLASLTAWSKIPENVKTEIDQRIQHQLNPSIVLGVFEAGQSEFYVSGMQNQALREPATRQSVYEIGSITKTFTSLLMAQLVEEGKLRLDDPVQKFWPSPFKLSDSENQAITLKQLATHTSGLPRRPSNFKASNIDPFADYDRSQLLMAIKQVKPQKSGVNYLYSNFAVGLLGETLALSENKTYNDLIFTRILQPLDLKQTHMQLGQVPKKLLAQGYSGNDEAKPWQFRALAGAGSIRSSIEDLLAYGVAHLESSDIALPDSDVSGNVLKAAMQLTTSSHYQQDKLNIGLGWHITTGGIIWHNGGTAGFRSILLIDPKQKKVVAGITNSGTHIEDITMHVMDQSKPMIDHQFPVAIDAAELEPFTGTFKHSTSDKTIKIITHKDRLFFTAAKQPRQALTFIGRDSFKIPTFKVKLAFNRSTENKITSLQLIGWGEPQTYLKTNIN